MPRRQPTQRQLAIIRGWACGHTDKEIAPRLLITPGTVRFHARQILRAFGARSRAEVVALACINGLVRQDDLRGRECDPSRLPMSPSDQALDIQNVRLPPKRNLRKSRPAT